MDIWAALAIGFTGSFHCIGMCGPIALALPGSNSGSFNLISGRILYNSGRIVTYSILGALFGLIGHSVAVAGFQQSLSVILGVAIILSVVLRSRRFESIKSLIRADFFFDRIKDAIGKRFKKSGLSTLFSIGVLNGLLPCGFVYVGLAGSLTTGSILNGALFMALFGLGTFPTMFFMSIAPGMISVTLRNRINRAIPYLAVTFGIYLIYRGFAFGQMAH